MDPLKTKGISFLKAFKKWILVFLIGVAGLLLTLAGLGLIQLSLSLILYIGLILLVLAFLFYFIG